MEKNLEILLSSLEESEKEVLIHRYGLLDGKRKTLKEVSLIMGMSAEWIRRLQSNAIKKLSHPTQKKYARNIGNENLKKDILW